MDTASSLRTIPPEEFPPLLLEIADCPKKLFVRGTLPSQEHIYLAVVGSRRASTYGKEVVRSLIQGLRGYPISIVSGLAIGIDGYAHESALEAGLHTLAVPGSGLDDQVLYPQSHKRLAQKILAHGGALISEFEPLFEATTWSFPKRNRIMAGMSHATLIIEASLKSGTLITARLALEYNRDVLVVPGSIFASGSCGPHMLLRDGATPITSSLDILEALKIRPRETGEASTNTYTSTEQSLLSLLENSMDKDTLIRLSGMSVADANQYLTLLELKGAIREHDGILMRIVTP